MNNNLKIALVQTNLVWENPIQNRINLQQHIEQISEDVDVIVLPEMFTSGFTMNAEDNAETMDGETVKWMQDLAAKYHTVITGSLIIKDNGAFHNRFLFVEPDGSIQTYNKRHAFTLAGEHKTYKAGAEKVIITYKGWKICPMICYDLRFPVWARNVEDYDVLIYVANWPKARVEAWSALLKARAIENMSYCIGVNRVGLDGNSYEYTGHSAAYDVLGNRLDSIPESQESVQVVTLEKEHISKYRDRLQFLNDRDVFSLE